MAVSWRMRWDWARLYGKIFGKDKTDMGTDINSFNALL